MRKIQQIKKIFLMTVFIGIIYANQAVAVTSNVLFIIDTSDRMSGKFPNFTKLSDLSKMQITTDAFQSLLTKLPKNINVGLEVYGHQGDKDCTAVQILNPVLPLDTVAISDNIRKLTPERGAIPLANALQQASESLRDLSGNKSIVVFSDGKDTCGGHPEEVVKSFQEQGIIVHVLGIDVKKDETAQLSDIATASNGMYYAINNQEDLEKSLVTIKEKLIATHIDKKIAFRDDFIEKSLSDQWNILNPDNNSLSFKKGTVTLLVSASQPEDATNILSFKLPSPEQDWIFSANFDSVPQSSEEIFELGIANKGHSQQIVSQIHISVVNNAISHVFLRGNKEIEHSSSYFHKKLLTFKSSNLKQHSDFFRKHIKSMTIRLQKFGNDYIASAKLETFKENDQAVPSGWITLQKLNSPPLTDKTFFIKSYLKEVKNGSLDNSKTKVNLHWVEVQTMEHSENQLSF